jgi:hypothetical protein
MKSLKSTHIILLIIILVFIVFLCWTLYSTIRNPKEWFTDVTESGLETKEEYELRKQAISAGIPLIDQKLIDDKLYQIAKLQVELNNNKESNKSNALSTQIRTLQSEIDKIRM